MNKLLHRICPFLITVYPVLALKNFNIAFVDRKSLKTPLPRYFIPASTREMTASNSALST
jgi:hypothetical protein